MGLDHRLIPTRLDSAAMQLIRTSAQPWNLAQDYPPFGSLRTGEPLPGISQQLLADLPAGVTDAGRTCTTVFGDRSYDKAEYLLDPVAFRAVDSWEEREATLPCRIVHGERYFADHAKSGQGIPWRYSTSGFLASAAATIDVLDVDAARAEFSVAEMCELGIYKAVHPDDDEEFSRVLENLRRLADHYRLLASHRLDVVVEIW